jgi:serine/threonine protein phosphatase 1
MRYYVVADPHGYYSIMQASLREAGYFEDEQPHKLVVCGDILDRGEEAAALVRFLLEQKAEDRLIYILGNHEDLFVQCLQEMSHGGIFEIASGMSHHYHNGTWDTMLQLSEMTEREALEQPNEVIRRILRSPFYRELLPFGTDYYETQNYVFCHGWIPTAMTGYRPYVSYRYMENWRDVPVEDWKKARWLNGMELACKKRIRVPGKTVVCGHWHTSYGHAIIDKSCSEWEEDADFTPFRHEGILALDGCTAHSGIVNCVVIEDEE